METSADISPSLESQAAKPFLWNPRVGIERGEQPSVLELNPADVGQSYWRDLLKKTQETRQEQGLTTSKDASGKLYVATYSGHTVYKDDEYEKYTHQSLRQPSLLHGFWTELIKRPRPIFTLHTHPEPEHPDITTTPFSNQDIWQTLALDPKVRIPSAILDSGGLHVMMPENNPRNIPDGLNIHTIADQAIAEVSGHPDLNQRIMANVMKKMSHTLLQCGILYYFTPEPFSSSEHVRLQYVA